MKNTMNVLSITKDQLIKGFLIVILGIASSCGNTHKPEDTKNVAEDHNNAKFNTNDKERDAQFLVNAAEINMEEIQLGQLSQQKSSMPEVKELAKMLTNAHTNSQAQLVDLAKLKLITLPLSSTDKALNTYKELDSKTNQNFDKAYCDMMVKGHMNALALFEKASTECSDSDIRAWALSTLPNLRTHLDQVLKCQNKLEKI